MAKNENTPPDGGDNLHIEIKRVHGGTNRHFGKRAKVAGSCSSA